MRTTVSIRSYGEAEPKKIRATAVEISGSDDEHLLHHVSEVAPVENRVQGTGSTTGASTTPVLGIGAPGADLCNYVDAVQVANKGATAVLVTLQDGSGGAALAYIYCGAGLTVPVPYPSPLKQTENTALYFQADGSTSTLYVSAQGHVG